jgi:predicted nucleotidyltransferase
VEAAFIFGSLARGDARADSDIDLLIYGNDIPPGALSEGLGYVYGVLDRKLDDKLLDREDFLRLNDARASFLPSALAGRKVWLIGSDDHLMRAVAA